eukprot:gene11963-5775_t
MTPPPAAAAALAARGAAVCPTRVHALEAVGAEDDACVVDGALLRPSRPRRAAVAAWPAAREVAAVAVVSLGELLTTTQGDSAAQHTRVGPGFGADPTQRAEWSAALV